MNAALAAVGAKYGMKISTNSMRFSQTNIQIKVEAAVIGRDGVVITKELDTLKRLLYRWDLKEAELANPITILCKKYLLVGYNTRKYARPFLLQEVDTNKRVVAGPNLVEPAIKAMLFETRT